MSHTYTPSHHRTVRQARVERPRPAKALTTPSANWKPEPCGLSREELGRIVRDILG